MKKKACLMPAIALLAMVTVATTAWAGCDEGLQAFNRGDYSQALRLLTPAAESGDARCQMVLAFMYETGTGVREHYFHAANWYHKAAKDGNAQAAYKLARLLETGGNGLSRDYSMAFKWYRVAAEKGVSQAKYHIGYMYEHGMGVLQDQDMAGKWYREAAKENIAEAGDAIARLTHRGTLFTPVR